MRILPMKKLLATLLLSSLIPTSANAVDGDYYEFIERKTILNLSETAEKEVEQDRIRATLRIQEEARENTMVQNRINKAMQEGVEIAKKYNTIKVSTGRYNVNERYNNKLRTNDGWKGSQEIILDSENKDDILELVQKLQKQGFNMSGMSYYLSRDKAASYRTELINEALKRVQDRAASVSKQLGAKHWHIGSVDVSGSNNARPMMRTMGAMKMSLNESADMVAPVVESGEDRVNVSIRVAVVLDMRD